VGQADQIYWLQAAGIINGPKDDLQAIRDCTHKGWALGRRRFIEKVEALTQRRAASKGVGRPRKDDGIA